MFSSLLFWIIVAAIVIFQLAVVELLNEFFHLYTHGLTSTQWIITVGISAFTFPISLFLRLLPICRPNDP